MSENSDINKVTTKQIQDAIEEHNQELEDSKKGKTTSVKAGNQVRTDVSLSEQLGQKLTDSFVNESIRAGRKNEQLINVAGTPKRFVYHAVYQKEKLEISRLEERRANSIVNMAEYIMRKKQGENVESFAEVDMEYRYKLANLYLRDPVTNAGMTREDFDLTEPSQMNLIIEGYVMRTEKPLPPPFETQD